MASVNMTGCRPCAMLPTMPKLDPATDEPVSELATDAATLLKQLRETGRPLVIAERGHHSAVLMDAEVYRGSSMSSRRCATSARDSRTLPAVGSRPTTRRRRGCLPATDALPYLWTDRALARLDEQAGFIAAESPGAARRMLEQVFMRVEALAEMPRSGRAYPGADDLDLRELVVGPTA